MHRVLNVFFYTIQRPETAGCWARCVWLYNPRTLSRRGIPAGTLVGHCFSLWTKPSGYPGKNFLSQLHFIDTPPENKQQFFFPWKLMVGSFRLSSFWVLVPLTKIRHSYHSFIFRGTNSWKFPEAILIPLPTQPSMSTSVVAKSPGRKSWVGRWPGDVGEVVELWMFFVVFCSCLFVS